MAFSKPPHTTTNNLDERYPYTGYFCQGCQSGGRVEVIQRLMILSEALTREGDVQEMRRLWLDVLDAESVLEKMKGCRV